MLKAPVSPEKPGGHLLRSAALYDHRWQFVVALHREGQDRRLEGSLPFPGCSFLLTSFDTSISRANHYARTPSGSPTPKEHHWNSKGDQFHVLPDRLLLKIGNIKFHHFSKGHAAPAVDLPGAGQPRFATEPQPVTRRIVLDLIRDGWTRADQAHLPPQHIDKLGQFVDAQLTDDASNPGYAGVIRQFVKRTHSADITVQHIAIHIPLHRFAVDRIIVVDIHRTKLEHIKFDAI